MRVYIHVRDDMVVVVSHGCKQTIGKFRIAHTFSACRLSVAMRKGSRIWHSSRKLFHSVSVYVIWDLS